MSIGWAHLLLIIGGILMPYTVLWPMSRLDRTPANGHHSSRISDDYGFCSSDDC